MSAVTPPVPLHRLSTIPLRTEPSPATKLAARLSDPNPPRALLARFAEILSRHAFDAIVGARSVTQLESWITQNAAQHLRERRALWEQARLGAPITPISRAVQRRKPLYPAARARLLTDQFSWSGCYDAVVLLEFPGRAVAVSLRLERRSKRWRATEVWIL